MGPVMESGSLESHGLVLQGRFVIDGFLAKQELLLASSAEVKESEGRVGDHEGQKRKNGRPVSEPISEACMSLPVRTVVG